MTIEVSADRLKSVRVVTGRVLASLVVLLVIVTVHLVLARANLVRLSVPTLLFICGAIGGFVSIQRRIKHLEDVDLLLMRESWIYTALAPVVGGVLALVLYMLFLSGLLAGDLFPKFAPDSVKAVTARFDDIFAQHGVGFQDYGKLLFWSFVAGYSEQFVTDIIGSFQKKVEP